MTYFTDEKIGKMADRLPGDVVEVMVDFQLPSPKVQVRRRTGKLITLGRKWFRTFVPDEDNAAAMLALLVMVTVGSFGKSEEQLVSQLMAASEEKTEALFRTLDAPDAPMEAPRLASTLCAWLRQAISRVGLASRRTKAL